MPFDDKLVNNLFREYSENVFNYSFSLLKNRDDAVQEVFIRLLNLSTGKSAFIPGLVLNKYILIINYLNLL